MTEHGVAVVALDREQPSVVAHHRREIWIPPMYLPAVTTSAVTVMEGCRLRSRSDVLQANPFGKGKCAPPCENTQTPLEDSVSRVPSVGEEPWQSAGYRLPVLVSPGHVQKGKGQAGKILAVSG